MVVHIVVLRLKYSIPADTCLPGVVGDDLTRFGIETHATPGKQGAFNLTNLYTKGKIPVPRIKGSRRR